MAEVAEWADLADWGDLAFQADRADGDDRADRADRADRDDQADQADGQALTSTRGYSLPDFLDYYPYPTRNFLLPDRVEGSEEHPLCPITDKSME